MIFPPVIQTSPLANVRIQRSLSVPGKVLVRIGKAVQPQDVVAEGYPAFEHIIIDIAQALGIRKDKVNRLILYKEGSLIDRGDLIAGPIGITQRIVRSPVEGKVVLIKNHLVIIEKKSKPILLNASMSGEVVDLIEDRGIVIETVGALIQGVWGNGLTSFGILHCITDIPDTPTNPKDNVHDKREIYYLPECIDKLTLNKVIEEKPAGLILGALAPELITMVEKLNIPVLVLIGFGRPEIDPIISQLLTQYNSYEITICAEKWDLYKGSRPEVIIPLPNLQTDHQEPKQSRLRLNQKVRVCTSPQHGIEGTIIGFNKNSLLPNGIQIDTASVQLSNGESVTIPLVNLLALN